MKPKIYHERNFSVPSNLNILFHIFSLKSNIKTFFFFHFIYYDLATSFTIQNEMHTILKSLKFILLRLIVFSKSHLVTVSSQFLDWQLLDNQFTRPLVARFLFSRLSLFLEWQFLEYEKNVTIFFKVSFVLQYCFKLNMTLRHRLWGHYNVGYDCISCYLQWQLVTAYDRLGIKFT